MEESLSQVSCISFLNVAQTYVPSTKVECHYTLPARMKSSTSDWIGIFKVEVSSIRDYETFVWAGPCEAPASGSKYHCNVQFQACYLPRPGEQQYHFRYVDAHGVVKGVSDPFVFNLPRPIEDLVTLEDEEASLDMILVIPKATFLQQQLELSQQERNDLMRVRLALEEDVGSLKNQIKELEAALETSNNKHAKLNHQYQDLYVREQQVREERDVLSCKETENKDQIAKLEGDLHIMSLKLMEKAKELEMLGTKKLSLETKKDELKQRLTETTSELERSQLQMDSLREKLRCTQDLLSASQQKVMLLGEELTTVSSIRDRTISDLHKSHLETADLAIKVSDLSLRYKEGMGQWWQEKTALNHSMEAKRDQIVNLKAEKLNLESSLHEERSQRHSLQCQLNQQKDASQVQLSESRRELSELKSALKVAQMEKEQLKEERQELMQYVRRLEERLDKLADEKWKEDKIAEEDLPTALSSSNSLQGLPDSDDESVENMALPQEEDLYKMSEQLSSSLPVFPRECQRVVINQPAPIACQLQPLPEDSSDSW
ncbi:calcium-binding and coiled-coil domain-containing protein 1 [Hyla sarda]|uniref:calcium-binding and coiled-coil domain-containing protein 1 n=1 Tax=Hyla sarda TaxID=327740 RepID=UPI0024C358F6|nr:calcium-binding and coiled-coil domain-containing protein 1 [Hyla sarda]XP_056411173.1 calcium-binding and coiled-coil domain-containing protein 1 [Hyla sarda]XP_056411174.1 calcium-binding and coiled-coil domain-containing protein 1 [Hyla sarda]XP_056411175.1 calcium-binding and coiled-coil domain-containing protein 1 [Hyla sarda]XP_056411176.1 calcium-binding and coiled-coil domain-containing protein 1 [Hyla sarda]